MKKLSLLLASILCGYLAYGEGRAQTVPPRPSASLAPVVAPAESLPTCITAIAAQSDPAKLATLG